MVQSPGKEKTMKDDTAKLLKESINELNLQLEEDERVAFAEDLRLIGSSSQIDSMAFVSLVAIIEDLAPEIIGTEISLLNDKAFSSTRSPFTTIATLGEYIDEEQREAV